MPRRPPTTRCCRPSRSKRSTEPGSFAWPAWTTWAGPWPRACGSDGRGGTRPRWSAEQHQQLGLALPLERGFGGNRTRQDPIMAIDKSQQWSTSPTVHHRRSPWLLYRLEDRLLTQRPPAHPGVSVRTVDVFCWGVALSRWIAVTRYAEPRSAVGWPAEQKKERGGTVVRVCTAVPPRFAGYEISGPAVS
jgi:hypothetical protein